MKRLVRRGETGGRGGGDNREGGRSRVVSEGRVCGVYVGHSSSHPFLCFLPLFLISSAIIPSLSRGCSVYLGGISIVNVCVFVCAHFSCV